MARPAGGKLVAAVALACLLAAARQASGRSLLDGLLPFSAPELSQLLRQGGEVVELLSLGASEAASELGNSFENFVHAHLNPSGPQWNQPNGGASEDQERPCEPAESEQLGRPLACARPDPDASRNVSEIIQSRGFRAQEFQVTTRDGYILTVQRIVNPQVAEEARAKLKPVILQHGLMSSSVDWVINSVDVRPSRWPREAAAAAASASATPTMGNSIEQHQKRQRRQEEPRDSQEAPNSLGFFLANEGYDVFLANSRGNVYGQRHVNLSAWQPAFWDFTFDEQIQFDLPGVIEFVRALTNHSKLGYVGHSQGTTMALGLLADRPEFADVLEPVVLLAPVAYVSHCRSPVKYFSVYTPIFQHLNMWFGSSNMAVRYLAPRVCGPELIRRDVCANLIFLACGFDAAQFNESRASAYLAHMPSGTSVKNIAHWGQEVLSGRFAHFDHGLLGNQARYKQARAPDYQLARVRSKSLALFAADNDWLASPPDVARLQRELGEPALRLVNVSQWNAAWNHIDFLYGKDCGRLVNVPVLEVFRQFD